MTKRKAIPQETQTSILSQSRRRCCICYGLDRNFSLKNGQIAHLDKNSANNAEDNLAFLCLDHHDEYDGTTSQRKNLMLTEVKKYRHELYQKIKTAFTEDVPVPLPSNDNMLKGMLGAMSVSLEGVSVSVSFNGNFLEKILKAVIDSAEKLHEIIKGKYNQTTVKAPIGDNLRESADTIAGGYEMKKWNSEANIYITKLPGERYHVCGLALWVTKSTNALHTGELDFIGELDDGKIEYMETISDEKCYKAELRFSGDNLVVSEESSFPPFGLNVSFAGKYKKTGV